MGVKPEVGLIPYSGEHWLITAELGRGQAPGALDGLERTAEGLVLAADRTRGEFVSAPIETEPFNQSALSWAADAPAGTWIKVRFRVRARDKGWSAWYDMGAWGPGAEHEPRVTEDPVYGRLHVDILKSGETLSAYQYRVEFNGRGGASPRLRRVSAALSMVEPSGEPRSDPGPSVDVPVYIDAPWLSQLLMEHVGDRELIETRVCAPASVAMALRYYGRLLDEERPVGAAARMVFDPVSRLYGNWAFMAAAGAAAGLDAWVERNADWSGIEGHLALGRPVIISIGFERGTFSAQPDRRSDGHIVVVRGMNANGDFVINDPGTAFIEAGDGVVIPRHELAAAHFGHTAAAVVIAPRVGD